MKSPYAYILSTLQWKVNLNLLSAFWNMLTIVFFCCLQGKLVIASFARATVLMDTKKTTTGVTYAIVMKNQQVPIWSKFHHNLIWIYIYIINGKVSARSTFHNFWVDIDINFFLVVYRMRRYFVSNVLSAWLPARLRRLRSLCVYIRSVR